jgi:hypothetical protein
MKLSDEDYRKLTEAVDEGVWRCLGDALLDHIAFKFKAQMPDPKFKATEAGVREALSELSSKIRIFIVAHIADVKEP